MHDLFDHRDAEVRWVTATAQLDRFEAIAYLIADLLDLELLLDEARPIGKRVQQHIRGEPRGVLAKAKAIWKTAKDARTNARAKAKKKPALAASLDDTLTKIDADRDRQVARLKSQVYEGIGLPPANSVIVKSRPRAVDPDPELTEAKLVAAEASALLAEHELEMPRIARLVTKMRAAAVKQLEKEAPKRGRAAQRTLPRGRRRAMSGS